MIKQVTLTRKQYDFASKEYTNLEDISDCSIKFYKDNEGIRGADLKVPVTTLLREDIKEYKLGYLRLLGSVDKFSFSCTIEDTYYLFRRGLLESIEDNTALSDKRDSLANFFFIDDRITII